ncbi:phage minor head protein [Streptomyces sp. NPDC005395]|uniref:phage minor head protein n=1 Tax=Streptomyces sp. NPDC005395 TaxID=3157042 RepID=UPI0033A7474E
MPRSRDEREMEKALVEAMGFFLDAARRAVLDGAVPPADGVLTAAGAPDMRNWPGEGLWRSTIDRLVRPVVERIYRRSYRATAGHDPVPADVQRQSDAAAGRVASGGWLRRVWAAAQQALTSAHTSQDNQTLQRAALGDVLTIDAASRATRDRLAEYRRIVQNAALSDRARAAALRELDRAELGLLPAQSAQVPDNVATALAALARARSQSDREQGRPWRAEAATTAVTETTLAESAGAYDAGQSSEQATGQQTARKRWVALHDPATRQLDDNVREAHRLADGQEVPLDSPFTVGGETLRYPGDPSGSPGNVINCRCSVSVIPAALAAAAKETPLMSTTDVTAAVTAATDLPFAPRDTSWDGDAARAAVRKWATDDASGDLDEKKYAKAFLWADPEGPPSSYKLPIATVVDGELRAVLAGVQSAASVLQGGQGGVKDIDASQQETIRKRLGELYAQAAKAFQDDSIVPPWKKGSQTAAAAPCGCQAAAAQETAAAAVEQRAPLPLVVDTPAPECPCQRPQEESVTAAPAERRWKILVASAGTKVEWPPPKEWFAPPKTDGPRAIRVTADGRISGHLAAWSHDGMPNCHVGYDGECVLPPKSPSGYRYFHQTTLDMPDGSELDVGLITMDTGHAPVGMAAGAAVSHYDDTGTMAAVVRAGEDENGVWVAGSVLPTLSEDQRLRLSLARYSGDWRTRNGQLELIAALAVPTPGFPNPSRSDYAMVAAGALVPAQAAVAEAAPVPAGDRGPGRTACGCEMTDPAPAAEDPDAAQVPEQLRGPEDDGLAPLDDDTAAILDALMDEFRELPERDISAAGTLIASGSGSVPDYVKRIAKHLQEKGFTKSHSYAGAWVTVKKMCSTGDATFPGVQKVNAKSRAQACAAVATIGSLAIRASANEETATAGEDADADGTEQSARDERAQQQDGEPNGEAAKDNEKAEVA